LSFDFLINKRRDVGFLRYWTFSNIPLFILALPVLITLVYTSMKVLVTSTDLASQKPNQQAERPGTTIDLLEPHSLDMLKRLALPQLLLSTLALTNYHIQIISRLSSGFVIWYMLLASNILEEDTKLVGKGPQVDQQKLWAWGKSVIRWSIGYALVQAVLFGGFLPPA